MKIMNIIAYFYPHEGGAETICHNLSKEMLKSGHDVSIITSNISSSIKPNIEIGIDIVDGIRVTRLKSKLLPGRLPYLIGLDKLIRELNNYQIIIVHTPYPSIAQGILGISKSINTPITTFHHCDYVRSGVFSLYAKILNKLYIRKLGKISKRIYVSTMQYASTSKVLKGMEDKFKVVPGAVRDDFMSKDNDFGEEYILCVSRLYWYKGIDYLLWAYKRVLEKRAAPPLWIVGRGPEEKNLKKIIQQQNLNNNVKLLGYMPIENMSSIYRNAFFLVLPSYTRREAFGMVLLEALANGKPVITTRIAGVSEVVEKTGGGVTARVKSPEDLANKMIMLLDNDKLRNELGKRGKEFVTQNWNIRRVTEYLVDDFMKIVNDK